MRAPINEEDGGKDGNTAPTLVGINLAGREAALRLNMLALPTLTPTPTTHLHQRVATSPRTLNRWVVIMLPSTPTQDSGSANTTARQTKPARCRNGGRGRGNGQGGSAEDIQDGIEPRRGCWKGRGGRGRGGARPADARPTHFLSLPLHNHRDLRDRVSAFQNALFTTPSTSMLDSPPTAAQPSTMKGKRPLRVSSIVDGLDSSIVIDPRRLHMTLGVMALQKKPIPAAAATVEDPAPLRPTAPRPQRVSTPEPAEGPRTVTTALALLRSLQPQISAILDGSRGVQVPLEVLDVLKTTRITAPKARRDANADQHHDVDPPAAEDNEDAGSSQPEPELGVERVDKVGAGVLFVGPKHVARADEDEDRRKLREVSGTLHPLTSLRV
ncbi:hypothetical protein BJ912DRAFT_1147050 [Pholiota molesta]|nr:hypothetical protein BJ912DRAFT_1147050 [Pholiota molesta]